MSPTAPVIRAFVCRAAQLSFDTEAQAPLSQAGCMFNAHLAHRFQSRVHLCAPWVLWLSASHACDGNTHVGGNRSLTDPDASSVQCQ